METFSTLLAICAGNSPVTSEFPAQRPVTRIFDVFFDLRKNKQLSKQWWGWWFEMPSRPLWRHCNVSCRTPLIVSQHCFRHLLGAIRQQAINWPNADTYPHLSHHIASVCHKELKINKNEISIFIIQGHIILLAFLYLNTCQNIVHKHGYSKHERVFLSDILTHLTCNQP